MSSLDRALKKIYTGDSTHVSDAGDAETADTMRDETEDHAADTMPDESEDDAAGPMPDASAHVIEQEVVERSVSPSVEELYEAARATTLSIYHDPVASMPPSPHADFSESRKTLRPGQREAEYDSTEDGSTTTISVSKSRKRKHSDESQSRRQTLRIDSKEDSSLKPAFQVDRFVWPQPCETLLEVADATIGQLAEALVADSRAGHKTWYLTSTRRGEGRTTLAICVARYLAQRGVMVALVDADFENPQLARRLGVVPQVGWESVLAGGAPLSEAMIHATGAGVTLVPLLSARIDPAHVSQNTRWSDTLRQLRQHFTLVVVDGGPLGEGELDYGLVEQHGLADLDAALLLRDVRNTPLAELAATERRLCKAGLSYGAVAETFTAEA